MSIRKADLWKHMDDNTASEIIYKYQLSKTQVFEDEMSQ